MAVTPLNNLSADTTRKRSPNVWQRFPEQTLQRIRNGDINGVVFEDDFNHIPVLTTPTITTQANYGNGWKAFGDAGNTAVSGGGAEGGTIVLATDADNDSAVSIATISLPFKIINTYGDFAFECRLKTASISDSVGHGIFVGLVEQQTLSAIIPIAADGTMADANFVGFHRLEGDGDQIDTVYKANGVTQVSAADQLHTALVADTYTKLGMSYDHNDGYFRFFQNNKELATKYALPSAAGTDFPNDVFMGLCVAVLNITDISTVTVDWIRAAQIYDVAGPY